MGGHEESNSKEILRHNNIDKDDNSWGKEHKKFNGMLKCYLKT
jgi:hypothetical protein